MVGILGQILAALGGGASTLLGTNKGLQNSSIGNFIFGNNDQFKKLPTGTPDQEGLHNDILSRAMGMSQQGGGYQQAQDYYQSLLGQGNDAYNNFSAPFLQNFEEQILPMIAERYAGGGALSSSGFGQAVGGAASGLQAQLAQLFASLQNQAAGSLTNQYNQLAQTGLGHKQFDYTQQPGSAGVFGPLLGALAAFSGRPSRLSSRKCIWQWN